MLLTLECLQIFEQYLILIITPRIQIYKPPFLLTLHLILMLYCKQVMRVDVFRDLRRILRKPRLVLSEQVLKS